MKTLNAFLLSAALLAGAVASTSAYAGGGGHYRHHHHSRIGVFIGAPLVFAPWYYPHPYYYYPPTVVVRSEPTVYIEKNQSAAQPSQAYWYYCPESSTYYPYVKECAVPWQREVPRPPPS